MASAPVGGQVAPRMRRLRAAFADLFETGSETGAALAARDIACPHATGTDLLLGRPVRWGLGVQVEPTGEWGMGGIGGCDAFANPARGYAYAFVTRRLGGFERSERLIEALEACL